MGVVVVPTYGSDPATVNAANLDAKVSGLATEFNGSIDNDNIKSAAAIAASKLNLASIAQKLTMTAKDFTEAKSADISSATTTTIWATDGNFAHITGTTTITSFGTAEQAGDERTIVFDGALTLTHNSTSLILPTGANITTAAGDTAIVRAETTANARVIAYLKKDGTTISSTLTTQGDILYRGASADARLAAGTAGQFLRTGGAGANPTFVSGAYIMTGTYTGNGSDNRTITIGFADTSISPKFVMVKGAATQIGVWKGADSHTGEVASNFETSADIATNSIQSFAANGFVIGTDGSVNTNAVTYHWMAVGAA